MEEYPLRIRVANPNLSRGDRTEQTGVILRADTYDLLNHANWQSIDTTIRGIHPFSTY